MEAALRNKLVKFSRTLVAFGQRLIWKFLVDLFKFAAFCTLIFLYGHWIQPPKLHRAYKIIRLYYYNYRCLRAVMSSDRCWGPYRHGKPVVKNNRGIFPWTYLKKVDQGSGQGVLWIENGAYTEYVSISIRGTTQPWALRRIFEIGSQQFRIRSRGWRHLL